MDVPRFDVLVIGAGPAGSVAALVLARAGARVALVDRASFPRDKACGDLVGPRGVQVLTELGITVPGAERVGDMVVVGPSGRRVRLPCFPGATYPGHGLAVPRARLDALLRQAAIDAGAEPFLGRAGEPVHEDRDLTGFELDGGRRVLADVVIGADGSNSGVAHAARLVDPRRVLWGFAVRRYVDQAVALPHIVFWEPAPRRPFPGYGWLFPGPGGRANLGLGLGMGSDRTAAARAARALPAFVHDLGRLGLLEAEPEPAAEAPGLLGGWLKMGMAGTTPARGRVLLVGDAAALVNPLQGEGIAQAMASGRAAADAVLAGPGGAAERYRDALVATYGPHQQAAAAVHARLIGRPRLLAAAERALTAAGARPSVAGGWSIYWNDLLDGALPGRARSVASAARRVGRFVALAGGRRGGFLGRPGLPQGERRSSMATLTRRGDVRPGDPVPHRRAGDRARRPA